MTIAIVAVLVLVPMLIEARLSAAHERTLRGQGAIEPADDVIGMMRVAYPGAFVVMLIEGALRRAVSDGWLLVGLVLFALSKGLKYWAIATLGSRWTFRVLVPPRSTLVTGGPYRVMRHPNYLGVMGELMGFALMAHATYAGPASMLLFAWLIARRIGVEERALHIHRGTHGDHAHRVP
jgi:methyltransferase